MTTIYLVRHGEYENPDYLFPGRSLIGFPLSSRGREQVSKLTTFFVDKHLDALYSSPILRCKQTVEILGAALSLSVKFDDRIQEVQTMAEGVSMKLFDETRGELSYTVEYQEKGAESMVELSDRMVGFVEEKRREHGGKGVLIVTHGDPMRFCVMKYLGIPITFATSRSIATPLAGGYRIEFDTSGQEQVSPIVT